MELILIPWALIWAIICSLIGARKGAAFGYFFLGLILGPIGAIIALVGKGNRVKCPYCKKLIDLEASVCPWCRSKVKVEIEEFLTQRDRRDRIGLLILFAFVLAIAIIIPLSSLFICSH